MEVELSVVIPVYRSATMLPTLVQRLLCALEGTVKQFEIILVEDGSPDNSWEVLCSLQQAHPQRLTIVQLMRNYGQENALMCGLRHCQGRYVVTMDDDLQHPPEEVPKLLESIATSGLDLVYGSYTSKKHDRWRNVGSTLINSFFRSMFKCPVDVGSFRIMRRQLVETICGYSLPFVILDGLLAWNTQRVGMVTVEHHERAAGRSGYSLRRLLQLSLDIFTNFSLAPLQLVSAFGLLAAGAGLLLGFYFVAMYFLSGISVPGYASTITVVLVVGGIQLLSLGIMGEYLGRVHLSVNCKPQYAKRQMVAVAAAAKPQTPGNAVWAPEEAAGNAAVDRTAAA